MNNKRFVTDIDEYYIIEKVTYEAWCNHLVVSSYFLDDVVMDQVEFFYPSTLIAM